MLLLGFMDSSCKVFLKNRHPAQPESYIGAFLLLAGYCGHHTRPCCFHSWLSKLTSHLITDYQVMFLEGGGEREQFKVS